MPTKYTRITHEEMRQALQETSKGFETTKLPRVREIVYEASFKSVEGLSIRVYTSIDERTQESRSSGTDAIRVVLIYKGKTIGGSRRVNRTQNWRINLLNRMTELSLKASTYKCSCGSYMIERKRKGKAGKFLGCTEYPKCKNTKNI